MCASARASAVLDAGGIVFFSDTLALVARDGATLALADGTRARADAAYLDLKSDRVVLAGHARLTRGAASASGDAIALDLDGDRVDVLERRRRRDAHDARAGRADAPRSSTRRGSRSPTWTTATRSSSPSTRRSRRTPTCASRPRRFRRRSAACRCRRTCTRTRRAPGFAASSLSGATFDQPYGLFGSPTSLTALHARWDDGPGAALALQQQIVAGDDAYVSASIDAPFRGYAVRSFTAYKRLGSRYTASADGSATIFGSAEHVGLTAAFGLAGGALDYRRASSGFSSFDASLRTPDRPLFGGATYRLKGIVGFDALRGGLLAQLPDARRYATVWRHALDLQAASPLIHAPLGTTLSSTVDVQRTWYAFPHHYDSLSAAATASRPLVRNVTLFAGYQGLWSSDVFPNAQALFYPTPTTPLLTPDGTPYYGYTAFSGARTFRSQNVDLQYIPNRSGSAAFRLSVIHTADFPQYNGYGRPQWEARADARFRPFPNVGIDVGRVYDFAWGGTRWQPRWSFAITP